MRVFFVFFCKREQSRFAFGIFSIKALRRKVNKVINSACILHDSFVRFRARFYLLCLFAKIFYLFVIFVLLRPRLRRNFPRSVRYLSSWKFIALQYFSSFRGFFSKIVGLIKYFLREILVCVNPAQFCTYPVPKFFLAIIFFFFLFSLFLLNFFFPQYFQTIGTLRASISLSLVFFGNSFFSLVESLLQALWQQPFLVLWSPFILDFTPFFSHSI